MAQKAAAGRDDAPAKKSAPVKKTAKAEPTTKTAAAAKTAAAKKAAPAVKAAPRAAAKITAPARKSEVGNTGNAADVHPPTDGGTRKASISTRTAKKSASRDASERVSDSSVQASPSDREPPMTDTTPTTAAPGAAEGATMAKSETETAGATTATRVPSASRTSKSAAKVAPPRTERSAAETEKIKAALDERLAELRDEYNATLSEITELQRDRLTDSAGDDQADTGTKTFEREQEITLANNILERVTQVERALERLDEGGYGWCERCGNPIPVERLAAFPSATLCVTCKQLEERR